MDSCIHEFAGSPFFTVLLLTPCIIRSIDVCTDNYSEHSRLNTHCLLLIIVTLYLRDAVQNLGFAESMPCHGSWTCFGPKNIRWTCFWPKPPSTFVGRRLLCSSDHFISMGCTSNYLSETYPAIGLFEEKLFGVITVCIYWSNNALNFFGVYIVHILHAFFPRYYSP